jgi:hypothetical protein
LERGFAAARTFRGRDDLDEEQGARMFGSLPALTLSPGFYRRADYLLWLERAKKAGLVEEEFSLAEAEGLMAVAEARAQFERNHPPCGACGALQDSPFAGSCHKCGTEFMKRSA